MREAGQPDNQRCENCKHAPEPAPPVYDAGPEYFCRLNHIAWDPDYWCHKWEPKENPKRQEISSQYLKTDPDTKLIPWLKSSWHIRLLAAVLVILGLLHLIRSCSP